jgi:hypothetical protein
MHVHRAAHAACRLDGCYTLLLASTEGTLLKVTDHAGEVMRCAGTCEEHVCLAEGALATRPSAAPTSLWGVDATSDAQLFNDHR